MAMTPELKAAVERRRLHVSGTAVPEYTDPDATMVWEDVFTIVAAFLAEHPEDDDEPATEAWMLENGFKQATTVGRPFARRFDRWYEQESPHRQYLVVRVDNGCCFLGIVAEGYGPQPVRPLGIATRRKMRLLLEVLADA